MSIRERAMATDSAMAFANNMNGSTRQIEEIMMLAELIAYDRAPRTEDERFTVQLADMLLAHEGYWSRLATTAIFKDLRVVWEEEE